MASERDSKRRSTRPRTVGELAEKIAEGLEGLQPGAKLPPIRQLAKETGASYLTVRRALLRLQDAGRVVIRHGSGVYVADEPVANAPKRIGLLLPDWVREYGFEPVQRCVNGFLDVSQTLGWHVITVPLPGREAGQTPYLDHLLSYGFDGVAWLWPRGSQYINLVRLHDRGLAVTACVRRWPDAPFTSVVIDPVSTADRLLERLAQTGRHTAAILSSHWQTGNGDPYAAEWVEALTQRAPAHGIEIAREGISDFVYATPLGPRIRSFITSIPAVDAYISLFGTGVYTIAEMAGEGYWGAAAEQIAVADLRLHFAPPYPAGRQRLDYIPLEIDYEAIGVRMAHQIADSLGIAIEAEPPVLEGLLPSADSALVSVSAD